MVQQLVDVTGPDVVGHERPTLVVGSNCRPHALMTGALAVVPVYATTHDGLTWVHERPPVYSSERALFLDPIDDTPVVFGQLVGDFESFELRDGSWEPAGFTGAAELEGAVRTSDGVTHVLAKVDGDHTLFSFSSPTEVSTMVLGVDGSENTAKFVTDRAREQLQMIYVDQTGPEGLGNFYWWSSTTGPELFDVGLPRTLTAAGELASPRAHGLVADQGELWFVSRSPDGTWSSRWVSVGDDWGEALPEDPVEGQLFVGHQRSVHDVATVVDLDDEPRWIWSQFDWDTQYVADEFGNWVATPLEGVAALYLGWLEDGEVASRLLFDDPWVTDGDAVIDASGTLHVLALTQPKHPDAVDRGPVYLRLGIE